MYGLTAMRDSRAAKTVSALLAVCFFFWACAPALALTPAGTNIAAGAAQATGTDAATGAPLSGASNTPAPVTVLAVYGVEWATTPANAQVSPGTAVIYGYRFRHTGNVGIAPAMDTFYYSATGTWLEGVYVDSGATIPATGAVQLSPNTDNEFEFYVKVQPPAGQSGTAATDVYVENSYYNANSADDGFGNPDRILHSVVTTAPDQSAPTLSISSPADNSFIVTSAVDVTGVTEAGASVLITVQPSGATYTATLSPSGNFTQSVALSQGANTIAVASTDA
ncbi:MAG: hypothetical protein AB1742_10820, partial [bacterium]